MKKLFLITLALGSMMVHANPAFETEIGHSPSLLMEYKNYEAKYLNQDLTVSISKPKFSNPRGDGSLFLSAKSDLHGVCKLYGFTSYVSNSKINYDAAVGSSINIDASSRFSNFDSNNRTYAIGILTCNTAENKPIPLSDNQAGRFTNDDGSITIKTPKFMMNGTNLYFSAKSDLNGVCKLYGLTSYVSNSKINYDAVVGRSVVIDASSRFSNFDSNNRTYAIGSLICR